MSGDVVCVATQADLDRVVAAGDIACCCKGGSFTASDSATVRAYDSATVTASDSATVRAYDSATVTASGSATVRAYDSATVTASGSATVTASGSATVRAYDSATVTASGSATVTAYGSATVTAYGAATVTASGSATVTASGSATVTASKFAAVHDHGPRTTIRGGVVITVPRPTTAEEWCEYHGVTVADGVATLYKAVRDDYRSAHGADYSPGSTPEAADWDGGRAECGGGLHFCARPWEATAFDYAATRYVACPVRVEDIAVHANGSCPQKVKARRVVAPGCYEVGIDGTALAPTAEAGAA